MKLHKFKLYILVCAVKAQHFGLSHSAHPHGWKEEARRYFDVINLITNTLSIYIYNRPGVAGAVL